MGAMKTTVTLREHRKRRDLVLMVRKTVQKAAFGYWYMTTGWVNRVTSSLIITSTSSWKTLVEDRLILMSSKLLNWENISRRCTLPNSTEKAAAMDRVP